MVRLFICSVSNVTGNTVDVNIIEKDAVISDVPVLMNCGMPEVGSTVYGIFEVAGSSVRDGLILGKIYEGRLEFNGSTSFGDDVSFNGRVNADNLVFDDIPLATHRHNGEDEKPSAE